MDAHNFPKNEGVKETLTFLMDKQALPGSDQEANLLLICLVSLLSIVDILQKQMINEIASAAVSSQPGSGFSNRSGKGERVSVAELKTERKAESKNKAVSEQEYKRTAASDHFVKEQVSQEQTPGDGNSSVNDKIVNKVKNKTGDTTSKIIKWDSMLKKKVKEPLSV
ncbi:hypothetical protein Dtox_0196 [Desulfofarcimen acetoxidans DSM 771]|uniref:Uncharacterized protein n=1 Tax=Desulfofarcimen acetoxidans (strain ATCC 49208 / DSM 771 / KCTC 5769 / VKM B-1644 / 5575) TaxID=485916 RepID=C8W2Z3_DESAS|nr:hypothetical protein [Desulfofarcimen acetoxidans]ACV61149.1 hypothetical protein Dtox_0196 [Desulfofarcimen acetoxidans DSM 771]